MITRKLTSHCVEELVSSRYHFKLSHQLAAQFTVNFAALDQLSWLQPWQVTPLWCAKEQQRMTASAFIATKAHNSSHVFSKRFHTHTYHNCDEICRGVTVMQMDWVSSTSLLATLITLKWYLKYCSGDGRQFSVMVYVTCSKFPWHLQGWAAN